MKFIFLSLLLLCNIICQSQSQKPDIKISDTAWTKRLSKMILADNQYFNLQAKGLLVLITIVPEISLKQKDSLLQESKYLVREISKAIKPEAENLMIDIAYFGRESDRFNLSFGYRKGSYSGPVTYGQYDTLISSSNEVNNRLSHIRYNAYFRHILADGSFILDYKMITKEVDYTVSRTMGEKDALTFLVKYLQNDYRKYSRIQIDYIDQNDGHVKRYEVSIDELIIANLTNYLLIYPKEVIR
jgi:hypothetical protein